MKKQVCSSLLALSMTASILSPAAMAAELTASDDNQNAISVVSETGDSSGNSDITRNDDGLKEETFGDNTQSGSLDLSENSDNSGQKANYPIWLTGQTYTSTAGNSGYMVYCTGDVSGVEEAVIPDTMDGSTVIAIGSFNDAKKLRRITIPKSVEEIKSSAFSQCTNLTTVYYGGTQEQWDAISKDGCGLPEKVAVVCLNMDDYEFTMNKETNEVTIVKYNGLDKKITIPATYNGYPITSIGDEAFQGSGVQQVTIPTSITSIGKNAFDGCTNLETVYYDGKKSTGWDAISKENCGLPIGVTVICLGDYNFTIDAETGKVGIVRYNVNPLPETEITVPAEYQGRQVTSINSGTFYGYSGLTSVTIPEGITSIGEAAFYSCSDLESVTLPNTLTSIGVASFIYCSKLKNVTIPDSVTSIGSQVFDSCTSLEEITISSKLKSIAPNAFANCTSLKKITIPDGITSIGGNAFQSCSKLEEIDIPDSVTSIGGSTFVKCVNLKKITLPDTIESIGEAAFYQCGLESITLPKKITKIEKGLFESCASLKEVTIPEGVTSIHARAFQNCNELDTIYYCGAGNDWDALNATVPSQSTVICLGDYTFQPNDETGEVMITGYKGSDAVLTLPAKYDGKPVTSIGDYAFQECKELTSITLPDSLQSIGDGAFDECVSLTSISIPSKVTEIGEAAFSSCEKIEEIKIPDGVTSIKQGTFAGCSSLKAITIPNSVTSIGEKAFDGCTLETAYYDGYEENISIADGNEPLIKVLTYKPKIICKGSEQVKISKGTHEMRIHGQSYGEYTFTWNEEQAGWLVQNAEKQYLSFADGELVLSDEPFIWHYDAKLYTTTEEKVQHNFWWWSYTTTKTVYWYLTGDGENLTISKSDKEADLALYDAVEATEHSFTEWSYVGDKTHRRVCTVCGEKETAECTYGEDGYCTECGQFNPDLASVSVTAKVTKHTTRSGWWWWCRPTTTWTANITAAGEGVDVETVEYSLDGEAYETGTCFTSKEEITTFYIRVTDSNDNVTNWIYEDGDVTQVTEDKD